MSLDTKESDPRFLLVQSTALPCLSFCLKDVDCDAINAIEPLEYLWQRVVVLNLHGVCMALRLRCPRRKAQKVCGGFIHHEDAYPGSDVILHGSWQECTAVALYLFTSSQEHYIVYISSKYYNELHTFTPEISG